MVDAIDPLNNDKRSRRLQAYQQYTDYLDQLDETSKQEDSSTIGNLKGHRIKPISEKTRMNNLFLNTIPRNP